MAEGKNVGNRKEIILKKKDELVQKYCKICYRLGDLLCEELDS